MPTTRSKPPASQYWSKTRRIVLNFIIARLKEPSTWAGIATVLTGFGIQIAPEYWSQIVTFGLTIAGGIAMGASEGEDE